MSDDGDHSYLVLPVENGLAGWSVAAILKSGAFNGVLYGIPTAVDATRWVLRRGGNILSAANGTQSPLPSAPPEGLCSTSVRPKSDTTVRVPLA
jgi:hypothetical protein